MLIIEESRKKSVWRFCLFLLLFVYATYDLFWNEQSVASSLYVPILWFFFGTLGLFSFLQIFYRREFLFKDENVQIVSYRFLKDPQSVLIPISEFSKINLKWHYKSRLIPRPNLQVILEHSQNPSLNIILKEAAVGAHVEDLRLWAKAFGDTYKITHFFDESLQVSQ